MNVYNNPSTGCFIRSGTSNFFLSFFFDRVSKILKVFSESCVYDALYLKISAFQLKQFGNGGHLKSSYENGNLISSINFFEFYFYNFHFHWVLF
jgi:hypothetical protein